MDGSLKSLVNPSMVRDMFSTFGEMISEELKYFCPTQQIYSKKLIYDAMHIGTLKKIDDEKHLNENLDGIVKINEERVKYEKKPEKILLNWNENIVIVISMILPLASRSKEYDSMKVLLGEKYVTLNENLRVNFILHFTLKNKISHLTCHINNAVLTIGTFNR